MSQSGMNNTSAGPSPPAVPTSFTLDLAGAADGPNTSPGTAVSADNNYIVEGANSPLNTDVGIQTRVNPDSSKNIFIDLTNRVTGSTTTTDAAPHSENIFDLGTTPGVYNFFGKVTAFNSTSTLGATWDIEATIRTTGLAGTEIAVEVKNARTEGAMSGCVVTAGVSADPGFENFLALTIQGYNTDTIKWNLLVEYRFAS